MIGKNKIGLIIRIDSYFSRIIACCFGKNDDIPTIINPPDITTPVILFVIDESAVTGNL